VAQSKHPEATRVDETRIEVEMPETQVEVMANQRPAHRSASEGEL
jgi:hypothetical protein